MNVYGKRWIFLVVDIFVCGKMFERFICMVRALLGIKFIVIAWTTLYHKHCNGNISLVKILYFKKIIRHIKIRHIGKSRPFSVKTDARIQYALRQSQLTTNKQISEKSSFELKTRFCMATNRFRCHHLTDDTISVAFHLNSREIQINSISYDHIYHFVSYDWTARVTLTL